MKKNFFYNKSVLITGASGSIGSVILKRLLKYNCKVIRAMSNDENGIYNLSNEIRDKNKKSFIRTMKEKKIRFLIGDVRDYSRNLQACDKIDIVIHAAAMKHVSLCEYNPEETIKTNLIGTKKLIKASIKKKIKKFIFISTDKSVYPSSIMGKSKRQAETFTVLSNQTANTKFSNIRFGNIIGSRGSVLLNFLSQIKNNKPITITHPEMTRFFITPEVATKEIIKAITHMEGGEIYIIRNMRAFYVIDLAKALCEIFNYKFKPKFIGLRDGEKIHEKLIEDNELKRIRDKKNLYFIHGSKSKKKFPLLKNKNFNSETAEHLDINEIKRYLIKEVKILNLFKNITN